LAAVRGEMRTSIESGAQHAAAAGLAKEGKGDLCDIEEEMHTQRLMEVEYGRAARDLQGSDDGMFGEGEGRKATRELTTMSTQARMRRNGLARRRLRMGGRGAGGLTRRGLTGVEAAIYEEDVRWRRARADHVRGDGTLARNLQEGEFRWAGEERQGRLHAVEERAPAPWGAMEVYGGEAAHSTLPLRGDHCTIGECGGCVYVCVCVCVGGGTRVRVDTDTDHRTQTQTQPQTPTPT
jgi:hypothetical protein